MFKKRSLYLFILFLSFSLSSFSFFPAKDSNGSQVENTEKKSAPIEPTPSGEVQNVDDMTINYENTFFKMVLTLVGLILLIFISFWTIRRLSQGKFKQLNVGRSIKILERRPLSAKSVLYLVEVGNKKIMIAESQLEVRRITEIDTVIQ